ncbi:hypothetical protein ACFVQ3_15445 [Oerskovia sp. NPDC057915]|uniref:hypothetical protein n=1 Tax=Oerskovia sp. NPDC057915 TaxID=3346280 RepID=UPI0036DA2A05
MAAPTSGVSDRVVSCLRTVVPRVPDSLARVARSSPQTPVCAHSAETGALAHVPPSGASPSEQA